MKKAIMFSVLIFAAAITSAQKFPKLNYKVGLITSLPTDSYADQSKVSIGSTMFEVYDSVSKKIDITLNAAYLRYTNSGESFAQIVLMPGVRYHINSLFHFGANVGAAGYNRKDIGKLDFIYSPFIGLTAGKITIDVRYLNTVKGEKSIKTNTLSFLYKL